MNVTLTAGGILTGLAPLVWYGARWAKTNLKSKTKNWKELIPLAYGFTLGILGAMCVGGLLGKLFGRIRQTSNAIGNKGLGTTTGAADTAVAGAHVQPLTTGGSILVVLAFLALIALWKKINKDDIRMIGSGAFSGSTVGTTAGIGGTGALALVPAVNSLGDSLLNSI
ncbi:hypothetical protein [Streptomyces rapamycinicus]|uniref:Uncharacterized protein n=2 Tax=Streptomyces rapamycinicus TaxID=1226757 RepID=A0A0A0NP67_STRRN|nr:hypothetical protein [Streptomyces rapamycinicus]AGP56175.1 hypothetical protein M271_23310 [Streptomyces rapamycinicus NRRL 5491]MBB4783782.1 hypothetical protein [Streptomyces rapamycinicus]RLV80747.1 hypothetical protein D3C57_120220 [Streptomyces rapamycinicus NRRL 5491]UTO64139.1 hypothetical protein LJB45_18605 [Streptomyces rapamycinicus]UTP32094.1 hypothetical protein LIV37_23725 [Streptomyces rapamycinicus NRRL 5491]